MNLTRRYRGACPLVSFTSVDVLNDAVQTASAGPAGASKCLGRKEQRRTFQLARRLAACTGFKQRGTLHCSVLPGETPAASDRKDGTVPPSEACDTTTAGICQPPTAVPVASTVWHFESHVQPMSDFQLSWTGSPPQLSCAGVGRRISVSRRTGNLSEICDEWTINSSCIPKKPLRSRFRDIYHHFQAASSARGHWDFNPRDCFKPMLHKPRLQLC